MKTCEYDGAPVTEARSHPWSDSVQSAAFRYYDLKASPARIRTSLEDWIPWSHYPAVEGFYAMLEWLNAPESTIESSDCAFTGPHPNESPAFAKPLQCSGRVIVLFRALELNVSRGDVEWMKDALHLALGAVDVEFPWGMIGTTLVPVRYVTLPGDEEQLGHQLMVSFWAWGSTEPELMTNLGRVVRNLSEALHRVEAEV